MTEAFPAWRWGSRNTPLSRVMKKLAATKVGSKLVRIAAPLDRALLERTDGKYTLFGPIGETVVLLTTIGRKSGQPRTQPLLCLHEGDTLFVIGSNFGRPHHPAWTANLLTNPKATVAIGGERIEVTSRLVDEPDKSAVFDRFVELAQAYAVYRTRTTRDLRIFALRRA